MLPTVPNKKILELSTLHTDSIPSTSPFLAP